MDFRENLLRKIAIDDLSRSVIRSFGEPDSGIDFDRDAMRQLLEMGPYRHHHERDLDLYVLEDGALAGSIVVLDSGLAIYRTTIDDVVLRKSPTIKEMVNIPNAIKILSDKKVVISRKTESVKTVSQVLIDALDLTYDSEDIAAIAQAGRRALGADDTEGVEQNLRLFAELLGLTPLPKPFRTVNHRIEIRGRFQSRPSGGFIAAPVLAYNPVENLLKLLLEPVDSQDQQRMEVYRQMLDGEIEADIQGRAVFDWLEQRVLSENPNLDAAA